MPQNDYMDEHRRKFGRRFDHEERVRKREARADKIKGLKSRTLRGIKGKLHAKKMYQEKVELKKLQKSKALATGTETVPSSSGAIPTYLLDRNEEVRTEMLTNMLKQKRKQKAGKWEVPVPKVKQLCEDEMFTIMRSGKRGRKIWKRIIRKASFVGDNFTRLPPKYERYIRPSGLRFKKAHVVHQELKTTFNLDIIGVKKNPQSQLFTNLGIITKGTMIEVNVSELGMVTQTGKIVWSKYAQVTNEPDRDGCINAVLLV